MRWLALALLFTVGPAHAATSTVAASVAQTAPRRVFVLPTKAPGAESLAPTVTDALSQALVGRPDLTVVSAEDVNALVQSARAREVLTCEDDEACLARIEEATQAELVVASSVGRVGRELLVNLSLYAPHDGRVINRVAESAESPAALLGAIPRLIARLFGSDAAEVSYRLPDAANLSFAVFQLDATGVGEATVANLSQFLAAELGKIRGARVISPADISSMLGVERAKSVLGAACDTECMANIAGALNVDYVIIGQLGRLESEYVVSLRLLDQRSVQVVNRVIAGLRCPEEELKRALRTLGRRLVGVDSPQPGTLAVSGPVSGGAVLVDGRALGEVPLNASEPFPSGQLTVRVVKDGYFDWQSDVFVQPGEANLVWAELVEMPDPWYKRWWVWTAVGAVVAGSVVAGVALGQSGNPNSDGRVVFTP